VIIRVEQGPTPVHVAMRHGIPASLRHTGTGKVFAAYRPAEEIAQALAREGHRGALDEPTFQRELDTIRRTGLARVQEEFMPGLCAMAVPVFDGFGQLALAIATIGPSRLLDLDPHGAQAQALRTVGEELSSRLGAVRDGL
jgi:DNA-binding IclR family transcriptional regulator